MPRDDIEIGDLVVFNDKGIPLEEIKCHGCTPGKVYRVIRMRYIPRVEDWLPVIKNDQGEERSIYYDHFIKQKPS